MSILQKILSRYKNESLYADLEINGVFNFFLHNLTVEEDKIVFNYLYEYNFINKKIKHLATCLRGYFVIKKDYKKQTAEYNFTPLTGINAHFLKNEDEFEQLKNIIIQEINNSKEKNLFNSLNLIIENPKTAIKNHGNILYEKKENRFNIRFEFKDKINPYNFHSHMLYVYINENDNKVDISDVLFVQYNAEKLRNDYFSLLKVFPNKHNALTVFRNNLILKKVFKTNVRN